MIIDSHVIRTVTSTTAYSLRTDIEGLIIHAICILPSGRLMGGLSGMAGGLSGMAGGLIHITRVIYIKM